MSNGRMGNDVVFGIRCLEPWGTCSGNMPKSSGGDVLERSRRHLDLTTTHGKLLSDPFTNQLRTASAAHTGSGSSFQAQRQPDRTTTDYRGPDHSPRDAASASDPSDSDQRVSFMGGSSVCPGSTLTFKPEVVGRRYRCGKMLGPGDASSPFFTNLFHCTVTRYSPGGTPS